MCSYIYMVISFCHNSRIWQTDEQIDRPCVCIRSRTVKKLNGFALMAPESNISASHDYEESCKSQQTCVLWYGMVYVNLYSAIVFKTAVLC